MDALAPIPAVTQAALETASVLSLVRPPHPTPRAVQRILLFCGDFRMHPGRAEGLLGLFES